MPLSILSDKEIAIVGRCLNAVVYGPFFDDSEFLTLFGVTREEARQVAESFPDVDEYDSEPFGNDDSWLVINNTFANIVGYPHGNVVELSNYISASIEEVRELFAKWRK
jgi:hypothetical protein